MRARVVLSGLLLIVATTAAVLSFAALRDLAPLCGFTPTLAWRDVVAVDRLLALVGVAARSVLIAATVAHRSWWTHPTTRLRRSLGGPVGWLDTHYLTDTCGATAVHRHAAGLWPQRDHHRGPVTWAGWEAGRLVSGPRHLRGRRVYSPWTRGIGILGPQGSGRTQYLIGLLLQAPGAVVVPSRSQSSLWPP